MDIVEEFLYKLTVIQWKKYQEEKPEQSGLHLVCAFGQVRSGYYNDLKEVWRYSASDFAELEAVTHWAYFPDAVIPSTE